ncbi:MAG: PEGA domain-containing protein, partial [Anaerosomatales bacterium]|nr:PEGA domain-containing protein [Anaerosomatales bacterium]
VGRGAQTRRARARYAPARARHPRRIRPGSALALLLGAAVLVALAAFLLTRPAAIVVKAQPADAVITLDGSVSATGTLEAREVEPGTHTIRIARKGFEPVERTVTAKRMRTTRVRETLQPQLLGIAVRTEPTGATLVVACSDGSRIETLTPCTVRAPAGKTTIRLSMAGRNDFERALFLDEPLSFAYILDPKGQLLHGLGTIATAGAPKGVSITPDGSEAWTSILNGPPSIEIFEPRSGKRIGEIDLGEHGAVEVVFNRAGTLAYTSQMETARCFEIDVKTRKVLRTFHTESAWTKWVELSPDEKTLYASNWSGDDVSVIDLTTGKLVRRIRASNTPRGMYATADGKTLYVGGFDSGQLDRIDLVTGKVTAAFKGGKALRHLVGDERTGRLYISDMGADCVWVHDMRSGTTKKLVDTDEKPNTIVLSPDGRVLFVSCRGENNPKSYYLPGPEWGSILVFDALSGKPLDAVVCGNQPTALDISADGRLLVSSDFLDNRLRVYEVPPYETLAAGGGGRYQAHFAEIKKR